MLCQLLIPNLQVLFGGLPFRDGTPQRVALAQRPLIEKRGGSIGRQCGEKRLIEVPPPVLGRARKQNQILGQKTDNRGRPGVPAARYRFPIQRKF